LHVGVAMPNFVTVYGVPAPRCEDGGALCSVHWLITYKARGNDSTDVSVAAYENTLYSRNFIDEQGYVDRNRTRVSSTETVIDPSSSNWKHVAKLAAAIAASGESRARR